MIKQPGTSERVLHLVAKGATLWIYFCSDFDGYIYTTGAGLRNNEREIAIDIDLALELRSSVHIREGYAGYRSDFGRKWSQMYEHINTPVPRWVTEQWEFES